MGRGKEERERDETQEFKDEERRGGKTGEKFISAHLPFYLPPSAQLSSDWSSRIGISLLYDHIRRRSIKLSRILHWTIKHPGIGI